MSKQSHRFRMEFHSTRRCNLCGSEVGFPCKWISGAPAALLSSPFLKSGCLRRSTYGKSGRETSLVKNTHNCKSWISKITTPPKKNVRAVVGYGAWKCRCLSLAEGSHAQSLISIHPPVDLTGAATTVTGSELTRDLQPSNQICWYSPKKVFLHPISSWGCWTGASLAIFPQWKENRGSLRTSQWKIEKWGLMTLKEPSHQATSSTWAHLLWSK